MSVFLATPSAPLPAYRCRCWRAVRSQPPPTLATAPALHRAGSRTCALTTLPPRTSRRTHTPHTLHSTHAAPSAHLLYRTTTAALPRAYPPPSAYLHYITPALTPHGVANILPRWTGANGSLHTVAHHRTCCTPRTHTTPPRSHISGGGCGHCSSRFSRSTASCLYHSYHCIVPIANLFLSGICTRGIKVLRRMLRTARTRIASVGIRHGCKIINVAA